MPKQFLDPDPEFWEELSILTFYWKFKVLTQCEDNRRMEMINSLGWPELREFMESLHITH